MNTTYNVVKQASKKFAVVDADNIVVKMFRVKRDAELHAVACNADNTVYDEEAFDVAEIVNVEDAVIEQVVETTEVVVNVEDAVIEQVVETTEVVVNVKAPRKSDIVRQRIATAKSLDETQEVIIAWTVAELGMTKQLARAYVLGNWDKV